MLRSGMSLFYPDNQLHGRPSSPRPPHIHIQAGLLTFGSSSGLRLPSLSTSDIVQPSSPTTAAGPSPILTEFPVRLYYEHLNINNASTQRTPVPHPSTGTPPHPTWRHRRAHPAHEPGRGPGPHQIRNRPRVHRQGHAHLALADRDGHPLRGAQAPLKEPLEEWVCRFLHARLHDELLDVESFADRREAPALLIDCLSHTHPKGRLEV